MAAGLAIRDLWWTK